MKQLSEVNPRLSRGCLNFRPSEVLFPGLTTRTRGANRNGVIVHCRNNTVIRIFIENTVTPSAFTGSAVYSACRQNSDSAFAQLIIHPARITSCARNPGTATGTTASSFTTLATDQCIATNHGSNI